MEETIRQYNGLILGYLDYQSNGDIVAKNSSRQILGRYERSSNTTKDFYGKILYRGNMASALLILK